MHGEILTSQSERASYDIMTLSYRKSQGDGHVCPPRVGMGAGRFAPATDTHTGLRALTTIVVTITGMATNLTR